MRGRRRLAGFGAAAGVGFAVVTGAFAPTAAAAEPSASSDPAPPAESGPAPGENDDKLAEREQQLAESQQKADYANQWAPLVVPEPEPQPEEPARPAPLAAGAGVLEGDRYEVLADTVGSLLGPAGRSALAAKTPEVRTAFAPALRVLQDAAVRVGRLELPALPAPESVLPTTTDASADRTGRHDLPAFPPLAAPAPAGAVTATKPTKLDDTNATTPSSPSLTHTAAPWSVSSVEPTVDQRLAERWRNSPVRGPPTLADALGNDGRTTIWQVAVVVGEEGPQVVITSQRIAVTNAGSAVAVATGQGSAQATGDLARTSVTQVSVVVLRGSGNATVHQSVGVANRGLGVAASAGDGSASAVGNASTTAVDQTVVVIVLGSGNGTVDQSAEVDNAGAAYALATDKDSTAVGTTSTTQIRQTAVVMVHDEDVTVSQNAAVENHGVGAATGATSTGNNSTTTIDQTTVHR